MLQRIQTFYLLIALILMLVLMFLPYGKLLLESGELIDFTVLGAKIPVKEGGIESFSTLPLAILVGLIGFLLFLSILFFKKRIIQIRLCVFNIILMIGSIGVMYYFMNHAANTYSVDANYNVLMVFPLVSAILTFLAIRAIGKDEALVRSIDRIR
jgi:hypothetical protein